MNVTMSLEKSFESTRVADVMAQDVVEVEANQSMCSAASTLYKHRVAAAPVVDEFGHCVGVLSAADYLKRDLDCREECDRTTQPLTTHEQGSGPFSVESSRLDLVHYFMSPAVQTVARESTLLQAAAIMSGEGLHHLIVLGEDERPVGLISISDIVRFVVQATAKGENDG